LLPSNYKRKVSVLQLPCLENDIPNLCFHILGVIFPVNVAGWGFILQGQSGVSDLRRQAIFEIEETCLADILYFGTGLADDCRFVTHPSTGVPAEDGKRSCTGTTGTTILLFRLKQGE
jgi:hypothetical protein